VIRQRLLYISSQRQNCRRWTIEFIFVQQLMKNRFVASSWVYLNTFSPNNLRHNIRLTHRNVSAKARCTNYCRPLFEPFRETDMRFCEVTAAMRTANVHNQKQLNVQLTLQIYDCNLAISKIAKHGVASKKNKWTTCFLVETYLCTFIRYLISFK